VHCVLCFQHCLHGAQGQAVRRQRCTGASPETSLLTSIACDESEFAQRHAVRNAQGLTWREVPAPAAQPGTASAAGRGGAHQVRVRNMPREVRPPWSPSPGAEGVCKMWTWLPRPPLACHATYCKCACHTALMQAPECILSMQPVIHCLVRSRLCCTRGRGAASFTRCVQSSRIVPSRGQAKPYGYGYPCGPVAPVAAGMPCREAHVPHARAAGCLLDMQTMSHKGDSHARCGRHKHCQQPHPASDTA